MGFGDAADGRHAWTVGYEKTKAVLQAACEAGINFFDALCAHYKTLVRYCNFEDAGIILGAGCGTPAMTAHSGYPAMACRFGRELRI